MPVSDVLKQLKYGELAYSLPSSYNIDNNIIAAIIESITNELNELFKAIEDVEKIKDIDFMFGKSIDYYGNDYDEFRQGDEDLQYLNRIRSLKISFGSLGDQDTMIRGLSGYFGFENNLVQIRRAGEKLIEIIYPTAIDENDFNNIVKKIKAAGIRYVLTKDTYWSDLTYEEIERLTYEELEKLRYERGELNARYIYKSSKPLDSSKNR